MLSHGIASISSFHARLKGYPKSGVGFVWLRGHVLKENQCVINVRFRGIIGSCAFYNKNN